MKPRKSLRDKLPDASRSGKSFVRDFTRRPNETQKIEPRPHGGGAVVKLGGPQLEIVEALVKAQPDALLTELCERLAQKTEIIAVCVRMKYSVLRTMPYRA